MTQAREKAASGFRWRAAALALSIPMALGLSAYGLAGLWFRLGPTVHIESTEELGVLDPNLQMEVPVRIRNIGTQRLLLSGFVTSCPTCVFVYRKTDKGPERVDELALDPGEATEVLVSLLVTSGPNKSYEPRIWFKTNDPRRPEASVGFHGTVLGAVICYPAGLALGVVEGGTPVHRFVQLRDTGRGAPYRLSRAVVIGCGTLHARPRQLGKDEKDPEAKQFGPLVAEVEVTGTLPAEADAAQEPRLELYEEGKDRPHVVPIHYTIRPHYEIIPPALVLPRMANGSPDYTAKLTVRLLSTTDSRQAVRVRELPPHVSVTRQLEFDAKTGTYTMEVRCDSASGKKLGRAKQTIRIDLPLATGTKTVDIPVTLWEP